MRLFGLYTLGDPVLFACFSIFQILSKSDSQRDNLEDGHCMVKDF